MYISIALFVHLCLVSTINSSSTISPRISYGKTAKRGAWPSQVLLITGYKDYNVCGGSIISEEWVLTAAHCVRSEVDGKKVNPLRYKLQLGAYDRKNQDRTEVYRKISKIVLHPMYETQNHSHDMALIKMNAPINFTKKEYRHLRPICLDLHGIDITNKRCFLTGFGRLGEPYFKLGFPRKLQQIEMKTFNQTECARIHNEYFEIEDSKEEVTDLQFCMVSKDTHYWHNSVGGGCDGDSGSPLQCKNNNAWYQVGVAWSGTNCDLQPTVFQKVHKYADFIEKTTNYRLPTYCN